MSDPHNDNRPSRPLSEISHLFLSTLRENAGGENRARPVRIPPGQRAQSPQLASNESFETGDAPTQRKRVTGIVGAQPGGHLSDAVLAYAASIASHGTRVGVMTVDAAEFKLQLVECDSDVPASEPEVSDLFDARQMNEAALELNHDVDRWLLVIGDHRRAEARALLSRVDDWTMLSTCDHDGIVSGYRTLKGLAEGAKSPLAIALLDAPGFEQAERAFAKLAAVCRQFLDWDVQHEPLETDVENAQAHTVLWCHAVRDKAQISAGPQWQVVQEFVELEADADANAAHYGSMFGTDGRPTSEITDADDEIDSQFDEDAVAMIQDGFNTSPLVANQPLDVSALEIPSIARPRAAAHTNEPKIPENPAMTMPTMIPFTQPGATANTKASAPRQEAESFPMPTMSQPTQAANHEQGVGEVIELPDGVSVLSAVLRSGTQLLATPIAPPMCPGATVAVDRDRGLVLVAQAGTGLAGMESIAAAVRWLDDSKQLIAMAMPQLAIDAAAPTLVQLLIDHADRTAEGLRPLLGNSRITIRTYRRLKWAGRTGLLLDAA